jgi:hypothetical protein
MSQPVHRILRYALVSGVLSAGVLFASPHVTSAATTPSASEQSTSTGGGATSKSTHTDRVEARIKELHAKLHITSAQQPQWDAVVQVMRDNAETMDAAIAQRSHDPMAMSAVDDLRSYETIVDAHADGLRKFIPVFQALYDSMSDSQKKNADTFFRGRIRSAQRTK